MRRRSWGWRLGTMAIAAVVALGLAACGDDDDSADTSGGGAAEITLRLGYVTPPEHPYGIAVNSFIDEVSNASNGAIAIDRVACGLAVAGRAERVCSGSRIRKQTAASTR